MAHVLVVPACQLCNPVVFGVLVESNDRLGDGRVHRRYGGHNGALRVRNKGRQGGGHGSFNAPG
jgi:hypothetical protein